MAKKLAVLAVHGMGKTARDFDRELADKLRDRLGPSKWSEVSWHPVFYQEVLQDKQDKMMQRMKRQGNVDGIRLRQFMLFSFSDAASMEARPNTPGSVYEQIQEVILASLRDAQNALNDPRLPVVIVAHSLGCQVISNYIWDAQASVASGGVFGANYHVPIGKASLKDKFLRLKTLRYLFTSGCNIPIFIAGRDEADIEPITVSDRGWLFRWENYYDPDDVLGWPLHPINRTYRSTVHVDRAINAGGFFQSWNPLSHNGYWDDNDFVAPVEDGIRSLL